MCEHDVVLVDNACIRSGDSSSMGADGDTRTSGHCGNGEDEGEQCKQEADAVIHDDSEEGVVVQMRAVIWSDGE